MWEAITDIFTSGDIWSIVIKVLITAALGGVVSLMGTLLAKLIAKNKESKIYKYAKTLVDAAEQKFPNEGTKMGPQKMEYVMSQIVIRFPSIKDNTYLYNIVEQAVYKLNEEKRKAQLAAEFEEKYGEKPLGYEEDTLEETQETEPSKEEAKVEKVEEKKTEVQPAAPVKEEKKKLTIQSF